MEKINFSSHLNKTGTGENTNTRPKIKISKKWRKPLKIFLIIFGAILGFYLIIGSISFIIAKPMINQVKTAKTLGQEVVQLAKKQDLLSADAKIGQLSEEINNISKNYQKLSYLKYVPLLSPYYQDSGRLINSAQAGVEAGTILLDTITPYADVLGFKGQGSFVGGTAEDRIVKIVQTLDKVTPKLDEVSSKIDVIEDNISQINPNRYPKTIKGQPVREQISQAKETLSQARQTLIETKPVIEVLPKLMGYPDKQKYLILFQNDGELRPTGGFITAYSVFDVESGKTSTNRSDDIYSLDSKLGNKIKPPEPLEEYLNVQAYHLRDMNWSPDFKKSMEEFLSYYEQIRDVDEVDGVITIDTAVLKSLVDILGPVEVPGFGRFTTKNDPRCNIPQVICELEYIVDEPIPDIVANRKSTILGPMMQELLFKAYGSPKQQWPALYQLLIDSLKEKHMLMYFKDDKVQQAAESFGAAGRISDTDGDYLMIVDSNLGGAKSNLYVTSEVEQKIESTPDGLVKTVTINYTHPEEMDDCNLERKGGLCLSGILQNYFRIYVPKGSELIEGLGSETEIASYEDLDKTVFAGFFQLRGGGGRAKIILKYRLPDGLTTDKTLPILLQKQAGTKEILHQLSSEKDQKEIKLKKDTSLKLEL